VGTSRKARLRLAPYWRVLKTVKNAKLALSLKPHSARDFWHFNGIVTFLAQGWGYSGFHTRLGFMGAVQMIFGE
jgi:hypothetical protein